MPRGLGPSKQGRRVEDAGRKEEEGEGPSIEPTALWHPCTSQVISLEDR